MLYFLIEREYGTNSAFLQTIISGEMEGPKYDISDASYARDGRPVSVQRGNKLVFVGRHFTAI